MKKLIAITISLVLFTSSIVFSQSKSEFEKNGIKIRFATTQLGIFENDKFELVRDMNIDGVFVFIPDKESIVLRHSNGNDELLNINSVKKTKDGNYVFDCTKNRVLFVSTSEKMATYSIAGDATMFVFPIDKNDILKLKSVLQKY